MLAVMFCEDSIHTVTGTYTHLEFHRLLKTHLILLRTVAPSDLLLEHLIYILLTYLLIMRYIRLKIAVCDKCVEFDFRFTELDDELKDGCITLKVRMYFLLVFLYAVCRDMQYAVTWQKLSRNFFADGVKLLDKFLWYAVCTEWRRISLGVLEH